MNEPIDTEVINFESGETEYRFEDAAVKQTLVEIHSMNALYSIDVG